MFFVRDAIFTKLQEHPTSRCMSMNLVYSNIEEDLLKSKGNIFPENLQISFSQALPHRSLIFLKKMQEQQEAMEKHMEVRSLTGVRKTQFFEQRQNRIITNAS